MFSWLSSGDYSYEILDTLLCLLILDKYSFILSRRYTPSALIAILKHAYSPCVLSSFPSCVADVDLSSFFCSLPSLFRFRFGQRLFFILSFPCGHYAVSSVSVSAATRLVYIYKYVP